MAGNDKKGEFKQERMFGRVAKIHIANTSNELVEMDFVDYGGSCDLLAHPGHFFSFFGGDFLGAKKLEETAEVVRETAISNWLAVFGAPGILVAGKEKRFIVEILHDLCASPNSTLQAVSP